MWGRWLSAVRFFSSAEGRSVAFRIFLRYGAERAGDAEAQNLLGLTYSTGRWGFPQSDVEAVKWFRKAAEQGHADGRRNLAICLYAGRGVCQDKDYAIELLRLAAAQGNETAQNDLRNLGLGE